MVRTNAGKKNFRIMVATHQTPWIVASFDGKTRWATAGYAAAIPGVRLDLGFPPVALPRLNKGEPSRHAPYDTTSEYTFSDLPASYLLRGSVQTTAEELSGHLQEIADHPVVIGVYLDHALQPIANSPSPPVGTARQVQQMLAVTQLKKKQMDGYGVKLAIVDTGINLPYLADMGVNIALDPHLSWSWNAAIRPGSAPIGHGTMCAFAAALSAPQATFLDIALLHPLSPRPGEPSLLPLLSDAVRVFRHLLTIQQNAQKRGQPFSLVVSNSWGMLNIAWDFPAGDPRNYSDNPNHPFHLLLRSLERAGADIFFAAGNCGPDSPSHFCQKITARPIYGASSSPAVTCVAGCDVTGEIMGYSSAGPGRLTTRKPDITGYTHFRGSGVAPADSGTSVACPVVAGVVAALRSVRPYNPANSLTSPSAIRNLITSTAIDRSPTGYDFRYGYGIINPQGIIDKLFAPAGVATTTDPPVDPPPTGRRQRLITTHREYAGRVA
ncbi:MAG: S8 family peptidase [Magnetococcus sp. YQC-3]